MKCASLYACRLLSLIILLRNMNYTYENSLDSPENRKEFYLVISFASIMFAMSCFGSLYVIYRTYRLWVNIDELSSKKKNLKMNHRLPFYTSCIGRFNLF